VSLASRAISHTNRLLKHAGLELRRKPRALIRSTHQLQMTVEHALAYLAARHTGPLSIVQVGAFDGASNDPVIDAIERYDCRALLIEPQPEPFSRLQSLHADRDNVHLLNVAIGDIDGERDFFTVELDGMPEWVAQLASFDRETIEGHQRYMPAGCQIRVQSTKVKTMTFETALDAAGMETVDVLQIDAEGYDLELLKLFDIPRREPIIVNFEHAHLSRSDRVSAVDLLVAAGYQVTISDGIPADTLAYRDDPRPI
jgi:FkbM family methyltransferase